MEQCVETGGYYAGNDHAVGYPTLRYDIFGMHRRTWDAGNEPYLQKNHPKYTEGRVLLTSDLGVLIGS